MRMRRPMTLPLLQAVSVGTVVALTVLMMLALLLAESLPPSGSGDAPAPAAHPEASR
jgi:hypothetical protein